MNGLYLALWAVGIVGTLAPRAAWFLLAVVAACYMMSGAYR